MFNGMITAAAAPQGNPLMSLLPLVLIFGIFYLMLIRPQQKKQKQHVQMLNSLKAGDKIITAGGIYGQIERVLDQNTFIVEIADGVKVKLSKNGIAGLAQNPEQEANKDK
ncbi:preprotein translocase subunit YajC [Limisalsivibrio acetivorans]|uniref:preprotein translocase subunit YajC n=1 Tax=Limisalsivibrio acetivorans TaxID=1304888 RepID=UPI0003B5FB41|nr:preprotein translocase subunit YajC [Limisalsivibrio acetivorans]